MESLVHSIFFVWAKIFSCVLFVTIVVGTCESRDVFIKAALLYSPQYSLGLESSILVWRLVIVVASFEVLSVIFSPFVA